MTNCHTWRLQEGMTIKTTSQPNRKAHIYFLLDRTGSMASMTADVIGGFNAFLAEQRADGDDARMTVVQFDSQEPFEVLADATRITRIADLTPATFQPRGSTPLLDATGNLITHATVRAEQRKTLCKEPESIVIATFTDGEENASRRYTRADILKLVVAKQADGWTFAFLGAGLDAYAESGAIGYADGSVQAWAPDAHGARMAFASLSRATAAHRGKIRRAEHIDPTEFFEGDKAAETDRTRRGR
jgi:Mg-chelatase subunit ChlD